MAPRRLIWSLISNIGSIKINQKDSNYLLNLLNGGYYILFWKF